MALNTRQQYRDINFLIQHLKKEDPHLYEALNVTDANVKQLIDTIQNPDTPPIAVAPPVIQERYIFGLAQGSDLEVGTEQTSYITVEQPKGARLFRWRIRANTAPTGSSIVIDMLRNGISIFKSGDVNKIVLPAGQIRAFKENAFLTVPYDVKYADELIPSVIQIGSTIPGFRIIIQLTGTVL